MAFRKVRTQDIRVNELLYLVILNTLVNCQFNYLINKKMRFCPIN